ncbi:hypothetical protein IP69_00835 [Bosea sp. AAP35]|uniref:hypothetical protein n=1 Tax=Bosea sp. AAP35 TaxID=1523417 RepID=UPI0006B9ED25|nr:hypothetical protein [Bosea sp. AAP35]KPF73140.1 hypothetical protein IP69_00835 [Bosea sp. AAP35]
MQNAAIEQPSDSESERRIMLLASDLAHPAWERVEQAYARGKTLADAKQAVLDEEVTRLAPTTEGAILDRLVQLVMQTPSSGLRPVARQRHRKIVLERLMEPYRAAGGAEPGTLAMVLYRKLGIVPAPLKAFWLARGERLQRVL